MSQDTSSSSSPHTDNFKDIKYVSNIGNVVLEFVADVKNKSVMFEHMNYEPEHVKIFLITLRKAINDFTNKEFDTIQQRVTYDDWNNFLKTDERWVIVTDNKTTETYVISCSVKNAMECIANGLGIAPDSTTYKTVI